MSCPIGSNPEIQKKLGDTYKTFVERNNGYGLKQNEVGEPVASLLTKRGDGLEAFFNNRIVAQSRGMEILPNGFNPSYDINFDINKPIKRITDIGVRASMIGLPLTDLKQFWRKKMTPNEAVLRYAMSDKKDALSKALLFAFGYIPVGGAKKTEDGIKVAGKLWALKAPVTSFEQIKKIADSDYIKDELKALLNVDFRPHLAKYTMFTRRQDTDESMNYITFHRKYDPTYVTVNTNTGVIPNIFEEHSGDDILQVGLTAKLNSDAFKFFEKAVYKSYTIPIEHIRAKVAKDIAKRGKFSEATEISDLFSDYPITIGNTVLRVNIAEHYTLDSFDLPNKRNEDGKYEYAGMLFDTKKEMKEFFTDVLEKFKSKAEKYKSGVLSDTSKMLTDNEKTVYNILTALSESSFFAELFDKWLSEDTTFETAIANIDNEDLVRELEIAYNKYKGVLTGRLSKEIVQEMVDNDYVSIPFIRGVTLNGYVVIGNYVITHTGDVMEYLGEDIMPMIPLSDIVELGRIIDEHNSGTPAQSELVPVENDEGEQETIENVKAEKVAEDDEKVVYKVKEDGPVEIKQKIPVYTVGFGVATAFPVSTKMPYLYSYNKEYIIRIKEKMDELKPC